MFDVTEGNGLSRAGLPPGIERPPSLTGTRCRRL